MSNDNKAINWDRLLNNLQQSDDYGENLTDAERKLLNELREIRLESSTLLHNYKDYHRTERWIALKASIENSVPQNKKNQLKFFWLRPGMVAAALAVLALSAGLLYWNLKINAPVDKNGGHYVQDIGPGSFGATLTLADGKIIVLEKVSSGELSHDEGLSISKSSTGKLTYSTETADGNIMQSDALNTLTTAKGQTYQVHLKDGTNIWLNAASSLTYAPNLMRNGKRVVVLHGEAYFDVAKDKAHPFIVQTDRQAVEVLGTHFNISSYGNGEPERTTLIQGSIKMRAGEIIKLLKPGEQGELQRDNIEIAQVDTDLASAWKNNEFVFESEPIDHIMKTVERWYNVQIVYKGEKPKDRFVGVVSRFKNVSEVLRILESTGKVHFEIDGRKIYVTQ